ncbi:MAG: ribosome maturation factor RimP [Nitrospinota bacterium]|nr:ribosome maturation factor RimP [Nitrospinota bacterium]
MDIVKSIAALLTPLLEREKLSLYDIEIVGGATKAIIRVYIDSPSGITHETCSKVSRHLSTLMEVEEVVPGEYLLEVSSPGLTRALKKPEHFSKSIGKLMKINFRNTYEGAKSIVAKLISEEDGIFTAEEIPGNRIYKFKYDDVAKARLEFEE